MTFRILLSELSHYLFRRLLGFIWYSLVRAQKVRIGGIRLYIPPSFSRHMKGEFYKGKYERIERQIIEKTLRKNDTVLELGAGVGYLGIVSRKILGPKNKVLLVEANPELLSIIHHNAKLNNVSLDAENCVLGHAEGTAKFYVMENFWSSSLQWKPNAKDVIDIQVRNFTNLIHKLQPTYLIADIEGGEVSLLTGQDFGSIQQICIEVHPHYVGHKKISLLLSHLFKNGFFIDFQISEENVLFLSRNLSSINHQ